MFLEPNHGWEIALARTERKTGVTHTEFDFECNGVTLEEDLIRRDLTINAIAIEVDWEATVTFGQPVTIGTWIDPFDGMMHIEDEVLVHVSDAFQEDPLRCLRVARFASRYPRFRIDPSLEKLMNRMALAGQLQNLTNERVWMEMEKALKSPQPQIFFEICRNNLGMFDMLNWMERTPQPEEHHPEGDVFVHTMLVVRTAAEEFSDPEVTFAALCHDFGKPWCHEKHGTLIGHEEEGVRFIEGFCKRWRIPNSYRNLAVHTCKQHTKVHSVFGRSGHGWVKPKSIMKMFEQTAALTHPVRFLKMLKACEADARGRGLDSSEPFEHKDHAWFREVMQYKQRGYLEQCLREVQLVETAPIAKAAMEKGKKGEQIGEDIRVARIEAIRRVQYRWKNGMESIS